MDITIDSTQYKLLLLFVFDKMEMPLTENTVYEFCTSANTWLSYMECKIAFHQLIEAGLICVTNANSKEEPFFSITAEGRVCLAHFFTRVPSSIRESVVKQIKQNRMIYRRKQEYSANYSKNADGTYKVILRIIEPMQPVIEIVMNVANRSMAKQIYERWEQKAPQVYSSIWELLVE